MKISSLKSYIRILPLVLLLTTHCLSGQNNKVSKSDKPSKAQRGILTPGSTVTGNFSICLPGPNTTQLTGFGTPHPITPWTSSDLTIASVSSTGLVTATGTFGFTTVTYRDNIGNVVSNNVYVSGFPTISGVTSTCEGTGQTQLTGSLFPNPTQPWVSSNTAIATVDNTGLVTGISSGVANITYTNIGGCTVTVPVTINPQLAPIVSSSGITYNQITFTWPAVPGASTYTIAYSINGNPYVLGPSGPSLNFTKSGLLPSDTITVFISPVGTPGSCFAGGSQTAQTLACNAGVSPTAPGIGTVTQPTCALATGSVQLTGLPAGTWKINPGAITGTGATTTISGLAAGNYTFTVTNTIGCPSPASANVTINPQPPTPTAPGIGTVTQTTCTTATGSIELTGLPTGTWTVNPGAITGSGTTTTISGLSPAGYTFTVTSAAGCTSAASVNTTINTQPPTPSAPTIGTVTQTTCALGTGAIQLTGLPAGAWTINPGAIAGSGASYTISGLSPANYAYTVTNAAGCTSAASANATINAQPPTPTAPTIGTITQTTCAAATGSIQLTGLPAGTWTINPGAITGSGVSTTISGLTANSYTFTVTNAAGCTSAASANATINAQPPTPPAPTIGTITQTTCALGTGSIQLTGLPAGTWTINPGAITGSGATTTISGLSPAGYTFTVTNAAGCTSVASANATINAQPPTPPAPTIGTVTQTTCATSTGSIELTGLPAGTWTINPGAITGSGATTTLSGLSPTGYTFTVTNAAGCTSTASVNTTINAQPPTPPAPTIGTVTQTTCASATGSIQLTGLPAGTWTINPGAITGSGVSTTISGLTANSYTFTVTNAAGCTSAASANATINAQPPTPPAPTIGTITQTTCALGSGSIQLTGLPAGTWTINPGAITGSGATTTISGLSPANYTFTVTNAAGCTSAASANATINAQPPTPPAPGIGTVTQTTCATTTGSIELTGLPGGTWTINPGAITGSGATATISGLSPAGYTFTVTNAAGCTSAASVNTSINAQPPTPAAPTIGTITQTTCASATGSVQLTGLPTGTWTINPGAITGTGTSTTISGLAANSYTFTVTNAAGCTSAASANATINAQPPTPSAPTIGTVTQTTCALGTGSIELTGLPAGTWTINPGAISGSGASTTIAGLSSGNYTYTVTNAAGCPSPASTNVTINTQPPTPTAPGIGTVTQTTCTSSTGSIELTGLPTGTWTINPGAIVGSGSTTTLTGLTVGNYTFTVTSAAGCTSIASANTTINAQPPTPTAPGIGTVTQTTCALGTGSIELTGLPTGTWTINPGAITGSGATYIISGITPGNYAYTVTNSLGCTSAASAATAINIQPVTPTAPGIGTITQTTCTAATGSIELTGLPAGNWTINPGSVSGSGATTIISGLSAGNYTFTVTNADGCTSAASANATINVQPPTPSIPVIGTVTAPTCTTATGSVVISGLPAGTWTLNQSGTIPNTINGNTTSTTISGLAAGNYDFTVTNSNGCTSAVSVNVNIATQPPVPTAPASTGNITACELNPIQTLDANNAITVIPGITITWYDAPTLGSVVLNPTLSGVGNAIYYAEADNGVCPSPTRTAVTLTINAAPAAPVSTGNITACELNPIQTLDANNAITPVTGITIRWYDALGNLVSSPTLSIVGNATYYAEAYDGTCPSYTRTAVALTIDPAPTAPASTGNITACELSPIQTLDANNAITPVSGITLTWYDAPSLGNIVPTPTWNTVGNITYYAEANDGTCPSYSRTAVRLEIKPAPAAPISTGNITACEVSPIQTLDAHNAITPVSGITISWYDILGNPVANPTFNAVGSITYLAEANDGTCPSLTRTSVTLTIDAAPAAPISTGDIVECEKLPIQTLDANNAITPTPGQTVTWYDAPTLGNIVLTPTLNSVGFITYYAESNDGTCPSYSRTAVKLTIEGAPAPQTSTGNITECEENPIQSLDANTAVTPGPGQTITWYDAPILGNIVLNPTLNVVGNATYYAEVNNGICPSLTRTAVVLTINQAPAAPVSTGNITACELNPIQTLDANNAITPVSGITIKWYDAPTLGNIVSSPTLSVIGNATYYAEAFDGTCPSYSRTAVALTIEAAPTAPVSTGNITACELSPIQTLDANNTITPVPGVTVTWYDAPTLGNIVPTPTLNTVSNITYYAEANDGTCPSYSRTPVTLTINPAPTAPVSTGNITVCELNPIQTLDANNAITPVTGITIRWYDALGNLISNPTLNVVGNVTYYAEAYDGTCPSYTRTAVALTINPAPAAPISTGNITACELNPIQTLNANNAITPTPGQSVIWYDAPTLGNIVSSPTLSSVGFITYYAESNDGTCPSYSRTPVTLTIDGAPAAPVSTGNITACELSPIQTLDANNAITPVSGITIKWYDAPSVGNLVLSPTLSGVGNATYYAEATNGTCPSYSRTAVVLTINAAPAAPISTGNITECQKAPIQTLNANAAITTIPGITINWFDAPTVGNPVANPILNAVGNITYYAEANDGTCPSYSRTAVTLTINAAPAAPTSTGNITQCEALPLQILDANNAVTPLPGETIVWYDAPTLGNVVTSPTLNIVGNATFYAQADNGCPSLTRTAVTLLIRPAPSAPIFPNNITECELSPTQTLIPQAIVPPGQVINWYTAANGGVAVTNPALTGVGNITYWGEADNGTCRSVTRTPVTLKIDPAPAKPTSTGNITTCEQSPIQTLDANTAITPVSGQTVIWYDAPSLGNVVANPILNTTGFITYYAESNNGTCPSYSRTAVTLTINAAPTPPVSTGHITQCEQSPIQTLNATTAITPTLGQNVTWYDAPTGGNIVLNPTRNTTGSGTYFAQSNDGTCNSLTRTPVTLTINPAPAAPISTGDITECEMNPIQILNANAAIPPISGINITWYNAASGGSLVASPTLNTVGTATYFAQADNGTCPSLTRTKVILTINDTPDAPIIGLTTQPDCTTSTGSVTIFPVVAGVTYSFDGGAFTNNTFYDNLPQNSTHTLVATNISGCISPVTNIVINAQPTTPNPPVLNATQPTCTVATGTITISGVTGETYSIDGQPFSNALIYGNIIAGSTHTFKAKNSAGCISQQSSITLGIQPSTPASPTLTPTQPTCVLATGSIRISGVIGETYSFNGGPFNNTLIYNNLSSGIPYSVIAKNAAGCTSVPSTLTLDPQPPTPTQPTFSIVQPDCTSAVGEITINGLPGEMYSFDGGPYSATLVYGNLPDNSLHTIVAQNSFGCISVVATATLIKQPETPMPAITDGFICMNKLTGIPFKTYMLETQLSPATHTFAWFFNGNPIPDTTSSLEATQAGDYSVIATNTAGCSSVLTTVRVAESFPGTSFATSIINEFSNDTSVIVTLNSGNAQFLYQLDDGPIVQSNIFSPVAPGTHTIHVTDVNGCTDLTAEIIVLGYIQFFTPNGDGFNDTWNIIGLKDQPSAKIHIFDRNGKYIKQISPTTDGWDGTMNGNPLPSTDYWFTVEYIESGQRKEFKSHFSLVR